MFSSSNALTLFLLALAAGGTLSCSKEDSDPDGGSGNANAGTAGSSGGAAGAGTQGGSAGTTAGTNAGRGGGATAGTGGAGKGGAGKGGVDSGGAGQAGAGRGGADSGGADSGGAGNAGVDSGGAGNAGGGSSVFPPGVTKPRIMIVGDSISAGPGCYKKYLVQNLMDAGITNYEFVGEYTDDCGGGVMHSAVSCTTSADYTKESFTVSNCFGDTSFPGMATLVETHDPDLVLIQLGVNDVWGGTAPIQPILENYATLIEQARAHNPNVVVVLAQIHKIITDSCTNTASTTKAEELVMAVPAWAARYSMEESRVLVADLWTNSDPHEADDCVHPNDAGAQRMGQNWFDALKDILN